LLIHQLPPRPDYLRVKVRRRLRRLGAVLLKSTVYALPWSEEAMEDFEWLRREIESDGGEAILALATLVAGLSDRALRARFAAGKAPARPSRRARATGVVPDGHTWVTRVDVHVDRIASAWLVRRFIDPRAKFKFVAPRGYRPAKGELRFDMYEAEFTHEGDRCTFETLQRRFDLQDPALEAIGQVIHDIDCKDAKFRRLETPRIQRMIQRIVERYPTDTARLKQGAKRLETLYLSLSRDRGGDRR